MRRLGSLDKALLALFLPLWIACFGLSLKSSLRQTWNPPVFVSSPASSGAYPAVTGFAFDWAREKSGLRVGDRLIRLEGNDLRGVGSVAFIVRAAEATIPNRSAAIVFEREGKRSETTLRMDSYARY